MSKENKLEFTGERFTPECVREIWYEHYHRYAFVKRLVSGKNVLDIACGEGYGSHVLSNYSLSVTGVDIDAASIEHAKNKYQNDNLSFVCASCLDIPAEDASYDVVVSFETLEHIAEHQQMLSEINRVLKPDGIIVISTPDKKHYSDATGFTNEYHVKELYKHEFKELLDKHWHAQTWYSQALAFNSIIEKTTNNQKNYSSDILEGNKLIEDVSLIKPMYYIVIASKEPNSINKLPDLHLFSDMEQSIYAHYNEVIKNVIAYGTELVKLRKQQEKILGLPIIGWIIKKIVKD